MSSAKALALGPRSALSEILELSLNGMGVGVEKIIEIVSLAEEHQATLSAEALEQRTQAVLETIYSTHLQTILKQQRHVAKVVLAQSVVRGFIVRRRVEQLTGVTRFVTEPGVTIPPWTTSKIWRRLTAVKELITSERIFVELMSTLKNYKTALKDVKIADVLFAHTDKLYKLHRRVLDKLLPLVEDTWGFSFRGISAILLKLIPKFSIYSDFIKSFKRTIDLLDRTVQREQGFAQRIEEVRTKLNSEHQLRELFFFPLYRISQYYTQLQTIAAAFHEDRTEQNLLLQTASVFYQMAEYLQNTLREVDRNETLFSIQQRIAAKDPRWHLAESRSRTFVREVEAQLDDKKCVLLLFNDILLICRASKSSDDLKMLHEPYELSSVAVYLCNKTTTDLYLVYSSAQTKLSFATAAERENFHAFLSLTIDQLDNKVFGQPLADLKSTRPHTEGIPTIIYEMVKYLEENALHLPNLFTYYPEQSQLDAFKLYVDGGGADFLQFDPYVIAFGFRVFCSEMPEPLLGAAMFDKIALNPDSVSVDELLRSIPASSRALLEFVLALLWRVVGFSDVNGYTIEQLATEFGYCLMRSKEPSVYTALANPKVNKVVKRVFEHYFTLFADLNFKTIFNHNNDLPEHKSPRRSLYRTPREHTPGATFQVPTSMNAPRQFQAIVIKKTRGQLPFPGVRINDVEMVYSYVDDLDIVDTQRAAQPFPGIRLHVDEKAASTSTGAGSILRMNKRLSSGTRVISSSKARLREVMKKADEKGGSFLSSAPSKKTSERGSPLKEVVESPSLGRKKEVSKAGIHNRIKESNRGSAGVSSTASPFPGIRMHVENELKASASLPSTPLAESRSRSDSRIAEEGAFPGVRLKSNNFAEAMTPEEEQFFKSHPAAFEVGNIVQERGELAVAEASNPPGERRKSKGKLSGLNLGWRLSAGKSRSNSSASQK